MKKDPSNETLFSLLGNVITVTDINKTLTINNFSIVGRRLRERERGGRRESAIDTNRLS